MREVKNVVVNQIPGVYLIPSLLVGGCTSTGGFGVRLLVSVRAYALPITVFTRSSFSRWSRESCRQPGHTELGHLASWVLSRRLAWSLHLRLTIYARDTLTLYRPDDWRHWVRPWKSKDEVELCFSSKVIGFLRFVRSFVLCIETRVHGYFSPHSHELYSVLTHLTPLDCWCRKMKRCTFISRSCTDY